MAYGFGQFGDWQSQDQRAWAYGVELGYRLPDVWAKPWMRVGINSGSGDTNPDDDQHGTFFQMLPTAWLYAQFPFYNMMNNQDVFVQWIVDPHPMVTLRARSALAAPEQRPATSPTSAAARPRTTSSATAASTAKASSELAYLTHVHAERAADRLPHRQRASTPTPSARASSTQAFSGRGGNYGFLEVLTAF